MGWDVYPGNLMASLSYRGNRSPASLRPTAAPPQSWSFKAWSCEPRPSRQLNVMVSSIWMHKYNFCTPLGKSCLHLQSLNLSWFMQLSSGGAGMGRNDRVGPMRVGEGIGHSTRPQGTSMKVRASRLRFVALCTCKRRSKKPGGPEVLKRTCCGCMTKIRNAKKERNNMCTMSRCAVFNHMQCWDAWNLQHSPQWISACQLVIQYLRHVLTASFQIFKVAFVDLSPIYSLHCLIFFYETKLQQHNEAIDWMGVVVDEQCNLFLQFCMPIPNRRSGRHFRDLQMWAMHVSQIVG